MNVYFDKSLIEKYHSNSQIARVLTEDWVNQNMYCPHCGNIHINHFKNNSPVADFYCLLCKNEYELKSKNGNLGSKINDGAYETMIDRITSNNNPDFFFMSYSKSELKVKDFVFIPKHFFVPEIIEKRKPLSVTAKRVGWIGCNILINKIPKQGRIDIISNGRITNMNNVLDMVNKSNRLDTKDMKSRGWLMDILNCVNKIPSQLFTLDDMYQFENVLQSQHPKNNNIKPKIRQQLQFLRDRGFIEFLGDGRYIKSM